MNIIYTLFSELSTTACSDISNNIYFNYISGKRVLDASVLANITTEISTAHLQVNKIEMNAVLSAFQLLYNVALSLTLNAIINISTITANASGINLPPIPSPFQNMTTFNTSVVGNIMEALAGFSNITETQKEYFISQLNTVYTVALQLPANTSSSINNAYLSAFVSGRASIDSATLSKMESELSAALPNLTSIQFNSVINAIKYIFELTSTLPINFGWNIYTTTMTAFGINLPLPTLIMPKPFSNMSTFDSSTIASLKQEVLSEIPSLTQDQLDFGINELNILYSVATRLNNNSLIAINDIVFNAAISGETYLDASTFSKISSEILSSLPDVTNEQMNMIKFAGRLIYEYGITLSLSSIVDTLLILSDGAGIDLPLPPPPFQIMTSFNTSVVGNIMEGLTGFSNITETQNEYIISQLNTVYAVALQLPANTSSSINNAFLSAFVTGLTSLDSATVSNMESELSTALPNLTSIQFNSVINAIKYMFELTSTLSIISAWNIYSIAVTSVDINLPIPTIIFPKPFSNMSTFDSTRVASFKKEMLSEIPSLTQDQLDFGINEMNILYTVAKRLNNNSLIALRDIVFNAAISGETYLDASTLSEICFEISSSLPDVTNEQMNMIKFAVRFLYEFGSMLSLSSIIDILVILSDESGIYIPPSQPPFDNITSLDQVTIGNVKAIIQTALPTYTQTQLDFIIYNLDTISTASHQLPLNVISSLTDLIYDLSITGVSVLDSDITSSIKNVIEAVPTNITQVQIVSIVESIKGLYTVANELPFNAYVHIFMILTNCSSIITTPPTAPFQNMKTFSTSTVASIKGEILTILPSLSMGLQDYIMFQMNIVYTIVSQLPISVTSTINNVLAGEYIFSSPFLDSTIITNISIDTSTALPNIDQRQLNCFINAVNFLYVIGSSLPVEIITNIYMYAGAEANITLPIPSPPPVFKNMTDFSPPVIASIIDILIRVITVEFGNPEITASQLQPIIDALNLVYNVVQRISLNGSTTIQNLMFNLYTFGASAIDSSNAENIQLELQSSIPNIISYQKQKILDALSLLLYYASMFPINAVLKIGIITSDASGIILPSPTPIMVIPIPDDEAVHNITAIITEVHPEFTKLQINNIIFTMDLLYTVAKMLPTDVVLNISGIAYNAYNLNGTELDLETQLTIQNVLLTQLPNFTMSQIDFVMSDINILYSVAQILNVNAVHNIISIAYNIMGFNYADILLASPPIF